MPGQADVEQHDVRARTSRPRCTRRQRRRGRCARRGSRAARASCARLSALSTLSSTTSTREPRCRPGRRSARPARMGAGLRLRRRGRRTRTRCPVPGPSLCGLDAAAVHLDQLLAPAPGRCRGRPARARARVDLREHVEHPRQHRRRNADAGVAARDHAPRAPLAPAPSAMRPPVGRVLGGVVEQVGDHLRQPRRVGPNDQRSRPRQAQRQLVAPRASISGRLVSTAFCSTVRRSTRSAAARSCPG